MNGLAELRKRRGFSQRTLARTAEMSPSTVYQIENGKHAPTPTTIRKLADALGLATEEVFEAIAGKASAPSPDIEERRRAYLPPQPIPLGDQATDMQLARQFNYQHQLLSSDLRRWEKEIEDAAEGRVLPPEEFGRDMTYKALGTLHVFEDHGYMANLESVMNRIHAGEEILPELRQEALRLNDTAVALLEVGPKANEAVYGRAYEPTAEVSSLEAYRRRLSA